MRQGIHRIAQFGLAGLQYRLRELDVVDVHADHVKTLYRTVVCFVRHRTYAKPAALAVRMRNRSFVGDGFTRQCARDEWISQLRGLDAKYLCRGPANGLFAAPPVVAQECVVDKRVTTIHIEIGDRFGNVVGEQTQLPFLLAQVFAQHDIIIDVGENRIDTCHLRIVGLVRNDVAAYPACSAARKIGEPFIGCAFTRKPFFKVRAYCIDDLITESFLDNFSDDRLFCDASPLFTRAIVKTYQSVSADITDR